MAKASQAAAGYKEGTPLNNCGICTMFRTQNACTAVASPISPYGLCKYYKARPNSFGHRTHDELRGAHGKKT